MTTAFHDKVLLSTDITQMMRDINALEELAHLLVLEWGEAGNGDGEFQSPLGLAVNSNDKIYVVDQGNSRIQIFDTSGNFQDEWGSFGAGDGEFRLVNSIAIDSNDNVYVTEFSGVTSRVQKFDSGGNFIRKWGGFGAGDGQFKFPIGIAIDSNDNIYVADSGNDRVQKFDSDGGFITKWGTTGNGNGQFNFPSGVGVDSSDRIYVSDTIEDRIQRFSSAGVYQIQWGFSASPSQIKVSPDDEIYVSVPTLFQIKIFDVSGNFISQFGNEGTGDRQFDVPYGIGFDSLDFIYVADVNNDRVQKIDKDQTEFFSYDPGAVSLGTPDGGVAVPSLDALQFDAAPFGTLLSAEVLENTRDAIEALAPFYINVDTSNPFDWTAASAENLYFKAVDLSDYGGAGTDYDWQETKAELEGQAPKSRDIGEIKDCITLLEASAVA